MKWSEKILNKNGWVYDRYYPAGDEYIFSKGKLDLRVAKDYSYILTYCGYPMRQLNTVKQLKDYELTGK